ncbi:MAG: amidase family protein [Rubrivivax sp.]|nr:amidase family protein [Rubrivivax sp.]
MPPRIPTRGTPLAAARALEGLPITIKDAFEATGFFATCGSEKLADHRPDEDAPAVARLRAAGVVIVGKTNVPEFSAEWQTDNALFGRTNNPWDVARSPGGSSGGAVVAVATGMTSFELGSDIAGSIRWPSQATGVFGHKSSQGLVPTRRAYPAGAVSTWMSLDRWSGAARACRWIRLVLVGAVGSAPVPSGDAAGRGAWKVGALSTEAPGADGS